MKHLSTQLVLHHILQKTSKVGAIALIFAGAFTMPTAIAQFGRGRPDFFEQGQRQFEEEIRRLEEQQPETTPLLTVEAQDTQ